MESETRFKSCLFGVVRTALVLTQHQFSFSSVQHRAIKERKKMIKWVPWFLGEVEAAMKAFSIARIRRNIYQWQFFKTRFLLQTNTHKSNPRLKSLNDLFFSNPLPRLNHFRTKTIFVMEKSLNPRTHRESVRQM